jgi:NodT family efflux transporter outer membrane factor (OMF) lipoprotein
MKKIIIISLAIISLAVCPTSCGLYKSYQRPDDIKTDGLFGESVVVTSSDTATMADIRWQEIFTDPHLQVLIDKCLANNTDLLATELHIRQAEAVLSTAKLAFLPSVFFAPEGRISNFNANTTKIYNIPVAASWEIDVSGRMQNAKKRAKAAYAQSQEYRQAVRTQLIAAVANHYYLLLMLDRQYEITAQTVVTWKESVETMRAMKEAGMATEAAVAQIEGVCFATEAALHGLRKEISGTQNSLALLLAESPHEITRGSLLEQTFPEQFAVGVPVQLLSNRPDVKIAELSLIQAHYAANEARASLYPSLNLSGLAGWTNNVGDYIVNPGKLLLSAAASLTQPLFNKGLNRAQIKIAEARREEAILYFRQTLLNAGTEVNNALTQYQTAKSQQSLHAQQVQAMERAVTSTELLMAHGSTTYLEILTARQGLLSAQTTEVADRFGEIMGIIGLYRALGGGGE